MQTLVQAICKPGKSIRERIVKDVSGLSHFDLEVVRTKKKGRPQGWAKLRSTEPGIYGAINLEWDGPTRTLSARIVNKKLGKPYSIAGRFVGYLMAKRYKQILVVNVVPR